MFLYYIICVEYARQGSLQEYIHLFLHGKSVYIFYILKVQRRDRCAGWWIDPNRNMNEEGGSLDIAGTEH